MPLTRTLFTVLMDNPADPSQEPVEYHVEVRATDQLRAELEGKRIPGLTLQDGMHTTYLWAWAAMVRLGHFAGKFGEFKDACITAEADKDGTEPVDPTTPAASDASA